jgi:hypothetical protein
MEKCRQNMKWVKVSGKTASLEINTGNDNANKKLDYMFRVIILYDSANHCTLRPFYIIGSTALATVPLLSASIDLF